MQGHHISDMPAPTGSPDGYVGGEEIWSLAQEPVAAASPNGCPCSTGASGSAISLRLTWNTSSSAGGSPGGHQCAAGAPEKRGATIAGPRQKPWRIRLNSDGLGSTKGPLRLRIIVRGRDADKLVHPTHFGQPSRSFPHAPTARATLIRSTCTGNATSTNPATHKLSIPLSIPAPPRSACGGWRRLRQSSTRNT